MTVTLKSSYFLVSAKPIKSKFYFENARLTESQSKLSTQAMGKKGFLSSYEVVHQNTPSICPCSHQSGKFFEPSVAQSQSLPVPDLTVLPKKGSSSHTCVFERSCINIKLKNTAAVTRLPGLKH